MLTKSLKVQCHHLASDVPEELRHVVRAVYPRSFGVDPAHLLLIVPGRVLSRIHMLNRYREAQHLQIQFITCWELQSSKFSS